MYNYNKHNGRNKNNRYNRTNFDKNSSMTPYQNHNFNDAFGEFPGVAGFGGQYNGNPVFDLSNIQFSEFYRSIVSLLNAPIPKFYLTFGKIRRAEKQNQYIEATKSVLENLKKSLTSHNERKIIERFDYHQKEAEAKTRFMQEFQKQMEIQANVAEFERNISESRSEKAKNHLKILKTGIKYSGIQDAKEELRDLRAIHEVGLAKGKIEQGKLKYIYDKNKYEQKNRKQLLKNDERERKTERKDVKSLRDSEMKGVRSNFVRKASDNFETLTPIQAFLSGKMVNSNTNSGTVSITDDNSASNKDINELSQLADLSSKLADASRKHHQAAMDALKAEKERIKTEQDSTLWDEEKLNKSQKNKGKNSKE